MLRWECPWFRLLQYYNRIFQVCKFSTTRPNKRQTFYIFGRSRYKIHPGFGVFCYFHLLLNSGTIISSPNSHWMPFDCHIQKKFWVREASMTSMFAFCRGCGDVFLWRTWLTFVSCWSNTTDFQCPKARCLWRQRHALWEWRGWREVFWCFATVASRGFCCALCRCMLRHSCRTAIRRWMASAGPSEFLPAPGFWIFIFLGPSTSPVSGAQRKVFASNLPGVRWRRWMDLSTCCPLAFCFCFLLMRF